MRRTVAREAMDEAQFQKKSLEGQIVVLEDLQYQVTEQTILDAIEVKLEEFRG